jgi:hypothetical protein
MTAGSGPLGALEASGLGRAMREWLWLYPGVEIVHIVGIALLFGSIAVLDLRLLGFSRGVSAKRLAAHVLPWTAAAFLLIVPSGLMMFSAHAAEFIASGVFAVKMSVILLAAVNAAMFHAGVFRTVEAWDVDAPPPAAARAAGALSLAAWIGVIGCGRLLAYF